jgi:hypothetical protein
VAGPVGRAVCGHSLAGIAGSNPVGGHGCLSFVCVVFCQVWVSSSFVQSSSTECGVSECDLEAAKGGSPGPLEAVAPWEK